jgi:hypothetical protein
LALICFWPAFIFSRQTSITSRQAIIISAIATRQLKSTRIIHHSGFNPTNPTSHQSSQFNDYIHHLDW